MCRFVRLALWLSVRPCVACFGYGEYSNTDRAKQNKIEPHSGPKSDNKKGGFIARPH
jgi:hypothetical protein